MEPMVQLAGVRLMADMVPVSCFCTIEFGDNLMHLNICL